MSLKQAPQVFATLPRGKTRAAGRGVSDETTYLAVQSTRLEGTGITPYEEVAQLMAYVNEGRWLVDCVCNNSLPVLMAARFAACISCGAIYRQIVIPLDTNAIEAMLATRPERNRNFDPRRGETVLLLEAENRAHGVR